MKKVLLTGATGFIGLHCLPALAAAGFDVHAVTSREELPQAAEGVTWHRANLLEGEAVSELLERVRPTHLLHLAWYAAPGKYWTSLENFRWVQASLNLFQAFAATGGRRVVVAGSCAEYEWGDDAPCSETQTPLRPATLYGACKHSLRLMLDAYAPLAGLSAAWGRIFFLYGPHEYPGRLVASVVCSLLKGEPALCSHGRQVRDFLYVKDVAAAFVALLDSEVEGAVNIAAGRSLALREVVETIADQLERKDLIRLGALPAPQGEPGVLAADNRRLVEEVGWSPAYGLREGLEETIVWWRQSPG